MYAIVANNASWGNAPGIGDRKQATENGILFPVLCTLPAPLTLTASALASRLLLLRRGLSG